MVILYWGEFMDKTMLLRVYSFFFKILTDGNGDMSITCSIYLQLELDVQVFWFPFTPQNLDLCLFW